MDDYFEYLDYVDPIVGYNGEYEIRFSDVYGLPKYQVSYEEYVATMV